MNRREALWRGLALAGLAALPRCGGGDDGGDPFHPDAPFNHGIGVGPAERVGGAIDGFHFPHFLQWAGQLHGWFIDHTDGEENDVGYATSRDGVTFAYQGKVLRKGEWYDRLQASFPAVARIGDRLHMLYEGKSESDDINSVCWATSKNGRDWTKWGPVIRPDDDAARLAMPGVATPGAGYADVDVGTPSLFHDGNVWHVWYHMTKREPWSVRIGYASGERLDALTCQAKPFLDLDTTGPHETGTVGARSQVVKLGPWYYMAYEWATATPVVEPRRGGGGLPLFEKSWWGTSLLRSAYPDRGWRRWTGNPLLENPTPGFGYDGPELLVDGGRLYLYYRREGNTTWRARLTF